MAVSIVASWESDDLQVIFEKEGGGFPTQIILKDKVKLLSLKKPQMSIRFGDGHTARPFLPKDCKPLKTRFKDAERISFDRLPWADENGKTLEHFYLSLRHEFWPDGTAFSNAFFFVEDCNAPDVKDLLLSFPLNFENYEDIKWSCIRRPENVDGSLIQSARPERFLPKGKNTTYSGEIIPLLSFDCFKSGAPCAHAEFLMEGQNALSGKPKDNASRIEWHEDKVELSWNFQQSQCSSRTRPYQLRNQWGWVINSAPTSRNLPPHKMYQYIDNYQRYPSNRQIDKMAAAGGDILVLHECWRLDAQNGGTPHDTAEFERVVERAHRNKMRVAPYIRGNEISIHEECADWFGRFLKKDFDGLYMDYGGPFHATLPDEQFPGGRIPFRMHYLKLRQLRETVGPNGLLYSHTGPTFSALGMTGGNVNGYISGEGEKGMMVRGRREHEYFSGAFASLGTMWTGAFPEYGTAKMIPFMAATGQYPHSPLGVQFASSSLAHPQEPGINDIAFRPLWKIWSCFRKETQISVFNDYNCEGVFKRPQKDAGHYLMVSKNGKTALLVVTNFSEEKRKISVELNWKNTEFKQGKACAWKLSPDCSTPGTAEKEKLGPKFSCELPGNGVCGWLFGESAELKPVIADFEKPYPRQDAEDRAYLNGIEKQRKLRNEPEAAKELYLQVYVDNLAVPYEESMWWDLYDNVFQIGTFDSAGNYVPFGWLSQTGFSKAPPEKKDYVWPGKTSQWMPLHEFLPGGERMLGIRSLHLGEPFYSFMEVRLSPAPTMESEGTSVIVFKNELEPDRSFMRFKVKLLK